jgi:Predicted nucleoside-diphosphate-sugar epimerases
MRKFVIIGGSGLIGTKLVRNLRQLGHEAIAASPSTGVDTLTGRGLAEALEGAEVVVDVSNSPSFEDKVVLDFFQTSTGTLLAAAKAAGVRHYVALSIVGTDRLPDNGYFRAKAAQERLIRESGIAFSIVRATQFFEFLGAMAQPASDGGPVRLSTGNLQPVAADDVAATLAEVATAPALNGIVEFGGPERLPLAVFVERFMRATGDGREIVADPLAPYFGAVLDDTSLTPGPEARVGRTSFAAWLEKRNAQNGA